MNRGMVKRCVGGGRSWLAVAALWVAAGLASAGDAPPLAVWCKAQELERRVIWYSEVFAHRDDRDGGWSGAKSGYEMHFRDWLVARRGGSVSHAFCAWQETARDAAAERDADAAGNRGFVNGAQRSVEFTRWRP
ncbi:hypothetical protein [Luteimonas arsenica]|uniref:hypothetical protein n=1 Tax=Luteimonas arsenica TaxID=1586242 RepID=UPI00105684CB|nr:hypothetical protein [Luteimonas arsenica]